MGGSLSCTTAGPLQEQPPWNELVVTLTLLSDNENVQNDFIKLLTHRGAIDGVREELSRCIDPSSKRQQIQMFRLGHPVKFPTTKECIQQLRLLHYRKDRTAEFIDLFQLVIYRARRRWIREFTTNGGLIDLLSVSSPQVELTIFNILFLLLSFVSVLDHLVLNNEQHILLKIADGLSNPDEKVRTKVHQIFHVVCIYKDAGRMAIYNIIEQLESTKKELLSTIINTLFYGSGSAKEAALRFLHALLDYEECSHVVGIAETIIARDIPKWLTSQINNSTELDSALAFEAARCYHLLKKYLPPPDRLREAMDRLHSHATEYHVETQATQVLISLTSITQVDAWEALIEHLRPSRVTPLSPRPTEPLPVHAHPRYGKYFRMLQVKVPRELVRQRMLSDGVDASLLESPDMILDVHSEASHIHKDALNSVSPQSRKSLRGQKGLLWHSWSEADLNGTVWPTLPPQSIDVDEVHVAFLSASQEPNDPTATNLLDSRRSKVIRKLLHEHKLTVARVIDTIFSENMSALGIDGITHVRHILTLPTAAQKTALLAYTGPPLPNPEGFLHTVYTIPSVELLFDLLWTVVTFDGAVDAMEADCALVDSACAELMGSTAFKSVLAYVLELGNHLNAGTDRGGASGFNLLTDLEKLSHVRQAESGTAMHFLAKILRSKDSNLLNFGSSLSKLPIVAKRGHSLNELQAQFDALQSHVDFVGQQVESGSLPYCTKTFSQFQCHATELLDRCRKNFSVTTSQLESTMLAFIKLPQETLPMHSLSFFRVIHEFSELLLQADQENLQPRLLRKSASLALTTRKPVNSSKSLDDI